MMNTGVVVRGVDVTDRNQCAHYRLERDIVAIRMKCCDTFYACIHCHEAMADHEAVIWGLAEREAQAILCGACHKTLSIAEYLGCGNACPKCRAAFNPGCTNHHHFYFELGR
jgi:uncharacterized CHY-type Zn-finger protein